MTISHPARVPIPAPAVPRMYRRNGGAVIGGVCGGIADHLQVDVVRVRIAFTLLSLLGAGIVMYALLWFMCRPGTDTVRPDPAQRRRALALAVLGSSEPGSWRRWPATTAPGSSSPSS